MVSELNNTTSYNVDSEHHQQPSDGCLVSVRKFRQQDSELRAVPVGALSNQKSIDYDRIS